MFKGRMGVNLGRGQATVPQQFPDSTNVGPCIEQMGGKAVPKYMRASFIQSCKSAKIGINQAIHKHGINFFPYSCSKKGCGGLASTKITVKNLKILSEQIKNWLFS